jgi:hypothetical protein
MPISAGCQPVAKIRRRDQEPASNAGCAQISFDYLAPQSLRAQSSRPGRVPDPAGKLIGYHYDLQA